MSDFEIDRAAYGASAWIQDWSIYAVAVYRWGRSLELQSARGGRWRVADKAYWMVYRVVELLTGITLPRTAVFGPGLRIHHFGTIVVHADVVAGRNCQLRQGVTLGTRDFAGLSGTPVLGDDVQLGAHAQVLGPVHVGDRVQIGALAVVTTDVPADSTVLGPRAVIRGGPALSLPREP